MSVFVRDHKKAAELGIGKRLISFLSPQSVIKFERHKSDTFDRQCGNPMKPVQYCYGNEEQAVGSGSH